MTDLADVSIDNPIHAHTLSELGDVASDKARWKWAKRHKEGRICPVCLDSISDQATTCSRCSSAWREILRNPRLLSEWIADVAQHERQGVRHLRLWEADRG